MKIILICGSLESGEDGVGDYSRRLAHEIQNRLILVKIIAINDPFVSRVLEEKQLILNSSIDVLRMPKELSIKKKIDGVSNYLSSFQADLISFQYVPNSYSKHAVPFWIIKFLSKIKGKSIGHLMFHEICYPKNNIKNYCIRTLQLIVAKKLAKGFSPKLIHTSNSVYQDVLDKINLKSEKLPVFSNIPIYKTSRKFIKSNAYTVGFFGHLKISKSLYILLEDISRAIKKGNHPMFKILIIGKLNQEKNGFVNNLEKNKGIQTKIKVTGQLSPKKVSINIQKCDLGIVTTPLKLLDKSGSASAFLEHGVPVIIPDTHDTNKNNIDNNPKEFPMVLNYFHPLLLEKNIKFKHFDQKRLTNAAFELTNLIPSSFEKKTT